MARTVPLVIRLDTSKFVKKASDTLRVLDAASWLMKRDPDISTNEVNGKVPADEGRFREMIHRYQQIWMLMEIHTEDQMRRMLGLRKENNDGQDSK